MICVNTTKKPNNRYSTEFKEQALSKARQRGTRTLEAVANELNLSLGSLKGWLKASMRKAADSATLAVLPSDLAGQHWSHAQRLLALNESHLLQGPALHAWCREKGLFEHQLNQWRQAFCSPLAPRGGAPQGGPARGGVSCQPTQRG